MYVDYVCTIRVFFLQYLELVFFLHVLTVFSKKISYVSFCMYVAYLSSVCFCCLPLFARAPRPPKVALKAIDADTDSPDGGKEKG